MRWHATVPPADRLKKMTVSSRVLFALRRDPILFSLFVLLLAPVARAQTVFTWTSGDFVTGVVTPGLPTTIASGTSLNVATGNDHDFNGRALVNNGVVNW